MERKIVVDPELKAMFPPHSEAEREALERALLRDGGCRDPLVVWPQENKDLILIRGHTRLEICERHGLKYEVVEIHPSSREAAIIWKCENQAAQRNLNESQRAMLADKIATRKQGARTDLSPDGGMSQVQAAKLMNVSPRSVQRAAVLREHGSPELNDAVWLGKIPVSVAATLTQLPPKEQQRVVQKCTERGDDQPARNAASKLPRSGKRRAAAVTTVTGERQQYPAVLIDPYRPDIQPGSDVTSHSCLLVPSMINKLRRELERDLFYQAVLFMITPPPLFKAASSMMRKLGFDCLAHIVCKQPEAAADDFVLYDHQLLLIGSRGNEFKPTPADRPRSIRDEEPWVLIDKMFPHVPKLAFFTEIRQPGWTSRKEPGLVEPAATLPEQPALKPAAVVIDESEIDLD